jgi:glycosyltransferase involved in cell wall biosynthesis
MTTYNHERFIKQAIESVLMQSVNFEYELVIGEDCSTDRTRELVLQLQREYPARIRLVLPERNLGVKLNFVRTLAACRGQYVALLEGDDYWTSPHKLQKQVDLMDAHPDYSSCFHTVQVVSDEEKKRTELYPRWANDRIFSLEDILSLNLMPTCSVMFRNHLVREFPDWWYRQELVDWPLHILNAEHGRIGFINEVMAAYRIHAGGIWSARDPVYRLQEDIKMLQHVNAHLKFRYDRIIGSAVSGCNFALAVVLARKGNGLEARRYARNCAAEYWRYARSSMILMTLLWLVVWFPRLSRLALSAPRILRHVLPAPKILTSSLVAEAK